MIAEFEVTRWILEVVAVRKPRETCEKAVKQKTSSVGRCGRCLHFSYTGFVFNLCFRITSFKKCSYRLEDLENLLVQLCWFLVEQGHFRIPICEKDKKLVCFSKLMISSQLFHSKLLYS
jgi:hypothetical protein